jgi:uncharacterized membrane protein HdeD (DUF308 family)
MKKHFPIYFYGAITILVGIFLLISKNSSLQIIKNSLSIGLIIGAIFAFITAFSRQRKHVQFIYHEIHALTMLIYGIVLILFGDSMDKLVSITVFLFIFYAFSEIIFCNWLFNLGHKTVFKIVIIRAILGFAIGIGTITAIYYTAFTLEIFGILFIIVGVNIILYAPVMQAGQSTEEIN